MKLKYMSKVNIEQIITLQTDPTYETLYLESLYIPHIVGYSIYKLKWWEILLTSLSGCVRYVIKVHLKDDDEINVAFTQKNLDKLQKMEIKEI